MTTDEAVARIRIIVRRGRWASKLQMPSEDIQQEAFLAWWQRRYRYQPERASEATFLDRVVNGHLRNLRASIEAGRRRETDYERECRPGIPAPAPPEIDPRLPLRFRAILHLATDEESGGTPVLRVAKALRVHRQTAQWLIEETIRAVYQ